MAITPRLELKQSQSLLMTQQLRQAINLLQVSNIELESIITEEINNNPLLEREEDKLSTTETDSRSIDDYPSPQETDTNSDNYSPDIDYDNNFDDDGGDREGYDIPTDYSWQDYAQKKLHQNDDDFDYFEQKLAAEPSLTQLLSQQINSAFSNNSQRLIAKILSENLDGAGYFRGNIQIISQRLKTSPEKISAILTILKTFEPSGIFAESLSECLKIQLQDQNRLDPIANTILDNLELLAAGKFKELKRISHASDEDLASVISDIKSLNPKPTADFDKEFNTNIIPDVFVKRHKSGEYVVELNQMTLPRILINQEYNNFANKDKTTGKYVKKHLSRASFLIRALHQRAETLLKVSEQIVKAQRDFFEYGIDQLKPLQLKDISEQAEVHESTVSRVVANKYIHSPRGIFELKYFFSNAAGKLDGSDDTSTLSIKHKIKELINSESPTNILSDDKLVELLAQQGIKIARRTIAKYRESMNIPTSAERKRAKRKL